MGIPPWWRDFQGTVGTVGNRFLVFHRLHGPAFSTALRALACVGLAQLTGGRVAADHVRAIPDRHRLIQMFMDGDCAAGQRTAEAALFQLPVLLPDRYRIVLGHNALGLDREHPVQVRSRGTEMAPAIAVQRAEQTLGLDHFPQPGHYRPGRLFLHQLPVVDLGRVHAGRPGHFHDSRE